MSEQWPLALAIVAGTVVAMEITAASVHRYIMHGWGWGWHKSHHEPRSGLLERNDLYALSFAAISLTLFIAGTYAWPLWWVGLGMVVYGVLYSLLHDGLVHRRFPFLRTPRRGYVKRLVQAHRIHHSLRERDGAVSFGFLYAPSVHSLIGRLRAQRAER